MHNSFRQNQTTKLREISHYTCKFYQGINPTNRDVNLNTEVTILVSHEEDNINRWGDSPEELVLFREVKTGFVGYYHLYPSGYGTYTYDPDVTFIMYDTDDIDWLLRYALTGDMRSFSGVQELIADLEIEKMLIGQTGDNDGST